MLSPTIEIENFLDEREVEDLCNVIFTNAVVNLDMGYDYPDDATLGRYANELVAEWHDVDFWDIPRLQDILFPKFDQIFGYRLQIESLHVLKSFKPYLLHNDVFSRRGINPRSFPNHEPEYTILIPLDDDENSTIVFNEYSDTSNNFETWKQTFNGVPAVTIDKKIIVEKLTHIHPADIKYLTLHKIFQWKKGAMFAADRRYFHCSDNYKKRGHDSKKCVVIRTARPTTR
jgi:hypothetical protein